MQSSLFTWTTRALLLAAAAVFVTASVVTTSANAKAVDAIESATLAPSITSAVQVAATRQEARNARKSIRSDLRANCQSSADRRTRGRCMREARNTMRGLRNEARSGFRSCVQSGRSRAECRDDRRDFWVNENGGGSGSTDTGGDPSGDRGED